MNIKAYFADYEKFLNVPENTLRMRTTFTSSETPLDNPEGWSGYSAYTWRWADEGGYDFVAYDFVGEYKVLEQALLAWGIGKAVAA